MSPGELLMCWIYYVTLEEIILALIQDLRYLLSEGELNWD